MDRVRDRMRVESRVVVYEHAGPDDVYSEGGGGGHREALSPLMHPERGYPRAWGIDSEEVSLPL